MLWGGHSPVNSSYEDDGNAERVAVEIVNRFVDVIVLLYIGLMDSRIGGFAVAQQGYLASKLC